MFRGPANEDSRCGHGGTEFSQGHGLFIGQSDAFFSLKTRISGQAAPGLTEMFQTNLITDAEFVSHVRNILAKLRANDRTHAVTIGVKRGIIDL